MRRVPYDSLVIIWGRLVVNWILEKVFSLLDSVFLSFLRWGKIFPLFGELLGSFHS